MISTLFKRECKSTSKQELITKKWRTNSLDQLLAEFGINFFRSSLKKNTKTKVRKTAKPLSLDLQQIEANQLEYSRLMMAKMKKIQHTKKKNKIVISLE
ncbi:hypothetical protein H0I23_12750 [Cellulophaga sp. HaHaR_3_176]|uniref:hypothetical protein n=1 Tax=Cellulophaga sp. HaHaR_3_176 TaxID=1942464 RepID=UPI001C1FA673|nr:hypothetical protein [Cellulophaga sp. HaHaR_3_176]QWX83316.1 hypothetical protein H0I23_12750 [Cellulophaga sp. HaHaR_3_176]